MSFNLHQSSRPLITQKRLHEVCSYNADTGQLIWKEPGNKRVVGAPIGSKALTGYLETCIDRKRYLVHRLIWLYHHGEFPPEHTDHINHNRTDNRIENLRAVSNRQNNFNQSKQKKQTLSKYRGVSKDNRRGTWKVGIKAGDTRKYLTGFKCEGDAAMVYNELALVMFGEYANLNEANQEIT